jgi:hypothetical protein
LIKTPFTSEEAMDMREAIDGHIANVNGSVGNIPDNSNMTKAAEASKDCLFLGAVTTDFTSFTVNLKGILKQLSTIIS